MNLEAEHPKSFYMMGINLHTLNPKKFRVGIFSMISNKSRKHARIRAMGKNGKLNIWDSSSLDENDCSEHIRII